MTEQTLTEWQDEIRKSAEYEADGIQMDLALQIEAAMKARDVSRSDLARRLSSTAAYVTKILRGDGNFTILSLVRLRRALGIPLTVSFKRPPVDFEVQEIGSAR